MIGVLVSGEGTNLQALIDADLPIVAVASNRDGVQALARARSVSIPAASSRSRASSHARTATRRWPTGSRSTEFGSSSCAGYMHLLRPNFLARFPGRVVNTHSAPLPAFPGAHPIEDVLAAGVAETAATIHYVDDGIDTGAVIAAERVPVLAGDTPDSLRARVQAAEHRLLPEVVRELTAA